MKKLVLLLLLSSISMRSFCVKEEPKKRTNQFEAAEQVETPQEEKKNFFPESVAFTIAQHLNSLEDVLSFAAVDESCYAGVKKMLTSKKLFRDHPENQPMILATIVKLDDYDKSVAFAQTFEEFCEALKIKDHKNLKAADYLTILDYLIANLGAQKYTGNFPQTLQKLVQSSHVLIKILAALLPNNAQAFQAILDAIQAEIDFVEETEELEETEGEEETDDEDSDDEDTPAYVKFINKIRRTIKEDKLAVLRLHYLTQASNILKNKNDKAKETIRALRKLKLEKLWRKILLQNNKSTRFHYQNNLFPALTTLKKFHLLDETIQHFFKKDQSGPRTKFINNIISFSIHTENYAPIKHLASRMNIESLINMIIATLLEAVHHYENTAGEFGENPDEASFYEFYNEITNIYATFIQKRIIPWYEEQLTSNDQKKKEAARKLLKKLYDFFKESFFLYDFQTMLEPYFDDANESQE